MPKDKHYPYEIKEVTIPIGAPETEWVRIGPKGFSMPKRFKEMAVDIYNMEIRPSDVFVFSFQRSGTTWTQELVWLVVNDLDYETAAKIPLTERYAFLEYASTFEEESVKQILENCKGDEKKQKELEAMTHSIVDKLSETPSPRFIKSHLPLSLLPPNALDAKMVHVARDPRDAIVSYYHLKNAKKYSGYKGDFKTFWKLFLQNYQPWTPYFENVLEAWDKRHHPNLLFLFYEDLKKDLVGGIRKVCDFFGKTYTDEQIAGLCEHLKFENFKKNSSVNYKEMKDLGIIDTSKDFVRQGKTGGWRDYFDDEMLAEAERWMEENLSKTDMRFPVVD